MQSGIIFLIGIGVVLAGAFGLSLVANYYEGDDGFNLDGKGCGTDGCGGSGGGGGGSCCSSGGTSTAETRELASDYYISQTGDNVTDFTVTIDDLGCHKEARIIKDGAVVMKLTVSGGKVTEI